MEGFMTNLYTYDYKAKAEADEDNDAEIRFMIANEGLDGDKEEESEVVNPRSRGNPQRFVNQQNQILRTVKWLNQQLR